MAQANIPYIIAEEGYYYVAYKEKVQVPEIVASSKGVANGLSEEYNDGYDFGPDSYDPNSTASIPYTQTSGIQEAINYAVANPVIDPYGEGGGTYADLPEIKLSNGYFLINVTVVIETPNNGIFYHGLTISGSGMNSTRFVINTDNSYGFTLGANQASSGSLIIIFRDLNYYIKSSTAYGWFNFTWTGGAGGVSLNNIVQGTTSTEYLFYISGAYGVRIYNYWAEGGNPTYISASTIVEVYGGQQSGGNLTIENCRDVLVTRWGSVTVNNCSYVELIGLDGNVTASGSSSNITIIGGNLNTYPNTSNSGIITVNGDVELIALYGIEEYGQILYNPSSTQYTIDTMIIDGMRVSTSVNFSQGPITVNHLLTRGIGGSALANLPNQKVTDGTTAGTVTQTYTELESYYKKYIFYFNGYENDTTTNQVIDFIQAFSTIASITYNGTGLTISATTSGITITAPDSTTTYSGIVIVEGY